MRPALSPSESPPAASPPASGVQAARRDHLRNLLAADRAYDDNPVGEPPLRAADYRRALFAILELLAPGEPDAAGSTTTLDTFAAGQRAMAEAIAERWADAWSPDRLADRPSRRAAKPRVDADGQDAP